MTYELMSHTTAGPATGRPRSDVPRGARIAAAFAALFLLANGAVALAGDPASLADHTRGAGAASEMTTGLAFLSGAVCLQWLTPVAGWRRLLWSLAPIGLAVGGVTMVAVPLSGAEPPGWLFLATVACILVGMTAAAVLGTRRVWPWWTGVAVALFLPAMFLVPLANGLVMMLVWVAVAATVRVGSNA